MTPALRASARHWIIGIAVAFFGVAINRWMAPVFDQHAQALLALAGQLVALSGLFILVVGIRRRLHRARDGIPAEASELL